MSNNEVVKIRYQETSLISSNKNEINLAESTVAESVEEKELSLDEEKELSLDEEKELSLDEDIADKEESSDFSKIVYIKHKDHAKIWEASYRSCRLSKLLKASILDPNNTIGYGLSASNPFIIEPMEYETFDFIFKYLNRFNDLEETPAPLQPLTSVVLSVIFGDESTLFTNFFNEDATIEEKLITMNKYTTATLYLRMDVLNKKLCAYIASFLKGLSIDEIKRLSLDRA